MSASLTIDVALFDRYRTDCPGGRESHRPVDFGVFDDVGPVFEDPLSAHGVLVECGDEFVADRVAVELLGEEAVDERVHVVGCGGEDVGEFVVACSEFGVVACHRWGGVASVGGVEPFPGLLEPGSQLMGAGRVGVGSGWVGEGPAGDGGGCVVPGL